MIYTSDNNCGKRIDDRVALDNLQQIAGRRISDLMSAAGNEVWLFPREKDRYGDKIENKTVFTIEGDVLTTENIMGFIGCSGTELTIHSRFSSEYEKDYFMQYLLQKVFAINIFDLRHSRSEENALDIAVLLFPYFLQKALLQGLFREYQRINYNDDRVKGTIDFNRHIKMNYPFIDGKVSYSTKEYRYDNPITQLVRHTIEHIRSKKESSFILFASQEIKDYAQIIIDATPSYQRGDLSKVISQNIRPISHPYYSEYRPLQRLCLQILRHEKVSYGRDSEKIHGVLFDGAWLWEEYLSITLKKVGFMHPQNKKKSGGIPVYLSGRGTLRYPDYIHPNIIADAKYKRLYRAPEEEVLLGIPRDDLNQMITYLHITGKSIGVFICPRDDFEYPSENGEPIPEEGWNLMYHRVGVLCGFGGEIHVISVNIPQTCESFKAFSGRMESIEASLEQKLSRVIGGEDDNQVISFA